MPGSYTVVSLALVCVAGDPVVLERKRLAEASRRLRRAEELGSFKHPAGKTSCAPRKAGRTLRGSVLKSIRNAAKVRRKLKQRANNHRRAPAYSK